MSAYIDCPYCGADDGVDVDGGDCDECGQPSAGMAKLRAQLAEAESRAEAAEAECIEQSLVASDLRTECKRHTLARMKLSERVDDAERTVGEVRGYVKSATSECWDACNLSLDSRRTSCDDCQLDKDAGCDLHDLHAILADTSPAGNVISCKSFDHALSPGEVAEEHQRILADAATVEPRWSDEVPGEPGWWWWSAGIESGPSDMEPTEVYENGSGKLCASNSSYLINRRLGDCPGEWWPVPIQRPGE